MVIFAIFASDVVGFDFINEFLMVIQFHHAFAVSSIPEAVMAFCAIGGFVLDEKHIFLFATEVAYHGIIPCSLFYVPKNLGSGLFAFEFRFHAVPELREIEFVAFPFVIEGAKELALQCKAANLRSTATDIEDGVLQPLAASFAD